MSNATKQVKKQLTGWGIGYYLTEYLPITSGLIAAMILNPSVWKWLIFILLAILIIGGLILAFKKSGKTIVWGIILVLSLSISGWVMYLIVGSCFTFAFTNDLIIAPKYNSLKNKYEQYKNQDEYMRRNN